MTLAEARQLALKNSARGRKAATLLQAVESAIEALQAAERRQALAQQALSRANDALGEWLREE